MNLTLIGQAVSEEKKFEILDRRRTSTTDDGSMVSYKLTYEPLAEVRANKKNRKNIIEPWKK